MSRHRIRRSIEPQFPYAISLLISCGLLVAAMFTAASFADPKSGVILPSSLAWSLVVVLPIAIPAVFYAEFKLRNRTRLPKIKP
jgi:hypothetical protein